MTSFTPHERRALLQVALTELRSLLRDRRAIFSAFVLPLLLYPALFLGQEFLEDLSREGMSEKEVTVVISEAGAPADFARALRAELAERRPIVILEASSTVAERIDDEIHRGSRDAAGAELELFEEAVANGGELLVQLLQHPDVPSRVLVRVHHDGAEDLANEALRRLREATDALEERMTAARLEELLGPDPAAGLHLLSTDLASDAQRSGLTLGRFLPLLAVIVLLSGGATAALAAFSGEREAGTLETLLVQPLRASVFVWGKFATVLLVSLFTLACNVASILACAALGLGSLPGAEDGGPLGADPMRVLFSALVFLPAVLLLCATLCLVSGRAKSFREGQHMLFPLLLVALAPTALSTQRDLELDWSLALVPLAGQGLAFRDALIGDLRLVPALIAIVSGLGWSLLALVRLAGAFDAERLFGSPDAEREAVQRRLQSRRALAWGWAGALVVYLAGGWLARWDPLRGTAVALWVVLPVFAWLSARATARRSGRSMADVLGLRPASPLHLVGALLLVAGLGRLVKALFTYQQKILPLPAGAEPTELLRGLESASLPLVLFVFALTPALTEELFFRGALLGGLREDLRRRSALVWQAVVFAVAHASIYRIVPTLLLGLVFGAIRLRGRSIWPAVALHMGYNAWIATSEADRPEWLDADWLAWAGIAGVLLLALPARREERDPE